MEQQNKYYTPSIEELHVGYECELSLQSSTGWYMFDFSGETPTEFIPFPDGPFRHWSKVPIIEKEDLFNNGREIQVFIDALKDNRVRTKYLDQSDIESCGWEYDGNDTDGWNKYYLFTGDTSWYLHHGYNNEILIIKYENHKSKGTFYNGECKSINELRKIMKWLNIK